MSGLSQDQVEKRAAIQKSATIFGAIVAAIAGLLVLWLLGGQGGAVRFGGAIIVAGMVGYLVYSSSFKSQAKSAACAKCGATFSRSKSDHAETLVSSEEKSEREEQADKSVKVTTWTEDKLDVVDSYACAKCGDVTTNAYQTTRKRDEATVVEPYEAPKGEAVKAGKGAAAGAKGGKSAAKGAPRSGKSRG